METVELAMKLAGFDNINNGDAIIFVDGGGVPILEFDYIGEDQEIKRKLVWKYMGDRWISHPSGIEWMPKESDRKPMLYVGDTVEALIKGDWQLGILKEIKCNEGSLLFLVQMEDKNRIWIPKDRIRSLKKSLDSDSKKQEISIESFGDKMDRLLAKMKSLLKEAEEGIDELNEATKGFKEEEKE